MKADFNAHLHMCRSEHTRVLIVVNVERTTLCLQKRDYVFDDKLN